MKYLKLFFRLLLGLFMTYAGFSHLTFNRQEFVAQVPTWLQFSEGFTDFVVLASGVVEIALGLGMLFLWKKKAVVGALLALFYVAIFPGNVRQSHRCLWSQHRQSASYPSVHSASPYLPRSLEHRRLATVERMVAVSNKVQEGIKYEYTHNSFGNIGSLGTSVHHVPRNHSDEFRKHVKGVWHQH